MKRDITVIGLGAGDLEQLPLGIYKMLKGTDKIFTRTEEHPVIHELKGEGVAFIGFDSIYEAHDQFAEVYEDICSKLLLEAEKGHVYYAVPGHPLVAESTVQLLLEKQRKEEINLHIIGGQSFLDPMFTALHIDPIDGFQLLDGTSLQRDAIEIRHHVIIAQVYDSFIASEVKLTLMEKLPDDYEVKVVTAAGSKEESVVIVPLYELDRVASLSNLTAVYVPPVTEERLLYREFAKLRQVIAKLRGPNGCPWDKEQTHESLKKYLVEEAYEVLDAIDDGDEENLAEELGDVLLQVLLHAQIGEDEGMFQIEDVIEALTEKMIRRHPHVFDNAIASDADKVVTQWEAIKKQEKGSENEFHSILESIPSALPSLLQAYKIQKKAAKVGFDWNEEAPMWMKLQEEISEWIQEIKEGNEEEAAKELGDILFVIVNLARFHGIDPEEALRQTNRKFIRRFYYIEKSIHGQGKKLEEQSLEDLDALWNEAKGQE
ncbi:tetrapyrrole methylase family protein/MazG family protein [Evansella vedderi]|uniref:Tetrapyrrole methylase family protein/MazG family protein n=1 Tax=Evansella vedderi TaxID=38282 RepID=A0ABU0A302_9BACI|nr:nucleoside triphosphate pyrophosphohydrolase [Evansella vedderi]MDQ0257867.1 tetrapyrrole methylase family protein/MazG family protein [Evansella vedderi]